MTPEERLEELKAKLKNLSKKEELVEILDLNEMQQIEKEYGIVSNIPLNHKYWTLKNQKLEK